MQSTLLKKISKVHRDTLMECRKILKKYGKQNDVAEKEESFEDEDENSLKKARNWLFLQKSPSDFFVLFWSQNFSRISPQKPLVVLKF